MTVTFLFQSMDHRQRATMKVDSIAEAVTHVYDVMNGGKSRGPDLWTFDEDGEEPVTKSGFLAAFQSNDRITLYDQGGYSSSDSVVICRC